MECSGFPHDAQNMASASFVAPQCGHCTTAAACCCICKSCSFSGSSDVLCNSGRSVADGLLVFSILDISSVIRTFAIVRQLQRYKKKQKQKTKTAVNFHLRRPFSRFQAILPQREAFFLRNIHLITLFHTECFIPVINVRKGTVDTPAAQ